MIVVDDKWRCEQDMIALFAIDGATCRVTDQSGLECRFFECLVDSKIRVKCCFGFAVLHKFHAEKQTTTANIANMWMVGKYTLLKTKTDLTLNIKYVFMMM